MDKYPGENGGPENYDFRQPMKRISLLNWKRNIDNIEESERNSLKIFKVGDKTVYFVTTNDRGQMAASTRDGKTKLLLEGAAWDVPAETLAILNKPKPPASGKK